MTVWLEPDRATPAMPGIVMLLHPPLDRAAEVARYWAAAGCPLVIHIDKATPDEAVAAFRRRLSDLPDIRFIPRRRCEWGRWSLVAATLDAARVMLDAFPRARHVYLASGSCLPLRPVEDLAAFLARHPRTDFIESVTTRDAAWSVGGLNAERFTLSFPFSYRTQRLLFDAWTGLQRRVGRRRQPPGDLSPHLGSQWWCLTRTTLQAILDDPDRAWIDRYFRSVWIPDESYFQTMARRHAHRIESRSLTLSKFDFLGKPHLFYDDHLHLLRQSDCFVARKIWPGAQKLYDVFLGDAIVLDPSAEPDPGRIDRVFAQAVERRTRGRPGLYMQSRAPNWGWENGRTAQPYWVLAGHADLIDDLPDWLNRTARVQSHGHLFAPDGARFAGGEAIFAGGLSADATLRDHAPVSFLTNLLWTTRGETQAFLFGPQDVQDICWFLAEDPNARVDVVTGSWAVRLWRSGAGIEAVRGEAADLQRAEMQMLERLRTTKALARIGIRSTGDFLQRPLEILSGLVSAIGQRQPDHLTDAPRLVDLTGFDVFVRGLRDSGLHPHLVGDLPPRLSVRVGDTLQPRTRPVVVR